MKIMVCYDSSEESKEAFRVAVEYAKVFSASLHVVESVQNDVKSGQDESLIDSELRKELSFIKNDLNGVDMCCVSNVVADDMTDGENLVEYAIREEVDAVFVGVRKVSRVGKLLFGSTAQFVILGSPCPVVSVKAVAAAGA